MGKRKAGTSLVVQWLRRTPAGDTGSIPVRELRSHIHIAQPKKKKLGKREAEFKLLKRSCVHHQATEQGEANRGLQGKFLLQ